MLAAKNSAWFSVGTSGFEWKPAVPLAGSGGFLQRAEESVANPFLQEITVGKPCPGMGLVFSYEGHCQQL